MADDGLPTLSRDSSYVYRWKATQLGSSTWRVVKWPEATTPEASPGRLP
ncbi:MAG: hypothetical protein ACR2KG_01905 [Nocardioidaceae bacterium]